MFASAGRRTWRFALALRRGLSTTLGRERRPWKSDRYFGALGRAGFMIGYAPRARSYHDVDPALPTAPSSLRIARTRTMPHIHEMHRHLL